ncbi:unnamed protein product [Lampetra planeri]
MDVAKISRLKLKTGDAIPQVGRHQRTVFLKGETSAWNARECRQLRGRSLVGDIASERRNGRDTRHLAQGERVQPPREAARTASRVE